MSGTKLGSDKAVKTIYAKYGRNFYVETGRRGGVNGRGHTFGHGKVDPSIIGRLGGKVSRRKGKRISEKERREIHKAYEELLAIHTKAKQEGKTLSYV